MYDKNCHKKGVVSQGAERLQLRVVISGSMRLGAEDELPRRKQRGIKNSEARIQETE
jgi:hypothetical protein